MTAALNAAAGERGQIRVFALDMAPEDARALRAPGAADDALGVIGLDPRQIEIIAIADLGDMGLAGYLTEGCGIPRDRIAADLPRLNALTGHVMIVFSRAFGGRETALWPVPQLDPVGSYATAPTDWSAAAPLRAASALPGSAGPGRTPPRAIRAALRRAGAAVFAVFVLIVAAVLALAVLR